MDLSNYLTIPEVAALLGRDRKSAFRWVKAGLLPSVRIHARLILVRRVDAERFTPPPRGNPNFAAKKIPKKKKKKS